MRWDEFDRACPAIAERARKRFESDQLVLLGTQRRDGRVRISPNECDFTAGRLLLGMMWQSRKALDIGRDARVTVHSVPDDRMNRAGDVKLYGRALDEPDPALREQFRAAIKARIDWEPEEPHYHLFSLDVEQAAFVSFGDAQVVLTWDAGRGLRSREAPGLG